MASAHELARGRERLRALIEFASDHRADRNARAQLRRADRQAQENGRG